jgi:hypothetical protein
MLAHSVPRTRAGLAIAVVIAGCFGIAACDTILVGGLQVGRPECQPESKRCGGTTPEICDVNGQWQSGTPCDPGKHCSGGACVVTCAPADLRCSDDNTPQICAESGEWRNNGPLCLPCTGCDPTTGSCRTAPLPDASPCQDPANKCILAGACEKGKCTAVPGSGQVECVAAGPCSPGVCDPNTGTCAAMEGMACDDGDACTPSSTCQGGICTGTPSSNHTWAHWNPQLSPDASPPSPRYTWTKNVVFDRVTKLTWQRRVPGAAYSWPDAPHYCDCLDGAQNTIICDADRMPEYPSGWRLPTRVELLSIVAYSYENPSIDQEAFPGTLSTSFWSSSAYGGQVEQGGASVVDFYRGEAHGDAIVTPYRVRCVR